MKRDPGDDRRKSLKTHGNALEIIIDGAISILNVPICVLPFRGYNMISNGRTCQPLGRRFVDI